MMIAVKRQVTLRSSAHDILFQSPIEMWRAACRGPSVAHRSPVPQIDYLIALSHDDLSFTLRLANISAVRFAIFASDLLTWGCHSIVVLAISAFHNHNQ